jgi:signal transduction histidine kinase
LSLRLGLIVATALALVFSALMLTFILLQRPGRVYGVVLPLPRQAAAMADLIENLPPSQWPTATAAMSTPATKVSVVEAPPATRGGLAMPGMTVALRAYLAAMDGRPVSIMAGLRRIDQSPDVRVGGEIMRATAPVRVVIGLRNGRLLLIEAMGPASQRFTGVRLGVLALSVTLLIGFGTLWFMNRQMKPLERLGKAVEQFGTRLEASTLKEEGTIELRQLIAAFNRLQANIGDLVRGRTRIITAVGHDLGTYLTRLRLRAEYIADAEQRERAIRDIDDMHGLMQETLALAKLQHDGEGDTPVDLVPLLKNTVAGFAEAEGPVRDFLPSVSVMVRIGPAAFARAAGNLIANALKYGREADVRLAVSGAMVELVVEDRGPGIPPEERAAVLEPFYRRDNARNLNQRGFGLGLAIVSEVVKGANGTLTLDDRDGGGLRVKIALPLA